MNENLLMEAMPRRVMTLFLVVDCSGSMSINGNIGKVNGAIEEMRPLLQEISDENADAEIKIAVLSFSTGCKWVTNGAESIDTFVWNDLVAGGITELGAAFIELDKKLSRKEFLASSTGAYAPVIILLTDGQPNDDWEKGLAELKSNNWYKVATKIAIGVEGDLGEALNVLSEFTGNPETVLSVNGERDTLKSLLCKLAVVSSTFVSKSAPPNLDCPDEELALRNAKTITDETLEKGDYGKDVKKLEDNASDKKPIWDNEGGW